MKPKLIRKSTEEALQEAINKMMTFEWIQVVENLPASMQDEALLALPRCNAALLELQNHKLAKIRDKLKKHDADLAKGRDNLKKALKKLKKVRDVLNAVSSILSLVAKIV